MCVLMDGLWLNGQIDEFNDASKCTELFMLI